MNLITTIITTIGRYIGLRDRLFLLLYSTERNVLRCLEYFVLFNGPRRPVLWMCHYIVQVVAIWLRCVVWTQYLNASAGTLGGMFIHERHAHNDMPRLLGWWGHQIQTRYHMTNGQFNCTVRSLRCLLCGHVLEGRITRCVTPRTSFRPSVLCPPLSRQELSYRKQIARQLRTQFV